MTKKFEGFASLPLVMTHYFSYFPTNGSFFAQVAAGQLQQSVNGLWYCH